MFVRLDSRTDLDLAIEMFLHSPPKGPERPFPLSKDARRCVHSQYQYKPRRRGCRRYISTATHVHCRTEDDSPCGRHSSDQEAASNRRLPCRDTLYNIPIARRGSKTPAKNSCSTRSSYLKLPRLSRTFSLVRIRIYDPIE